MPAYLQWELTIASLKLHGGCSERICRVAIVDAVVPKVLFLVRLSRLLFMLLKTLLIEDNLFHCGVMQIYGLTPKQTDISLQYN